jgi:hypothetical protein
VSGAKRLFILLSAISLGVIALSLALFYGVGEGEPGPLPLKDTLFGLVDRAARSGWLEEEEMEEYLNSVGWTADRLERTMDNIAEEDPELFWELLGDLEDYALERHGVELWELGLG